MTELTKSEFKPIFIGGSGRSGTTLLRTLLDRHKDLAMINECMFFGTVAKRHAEGHDGLLELWNQEPECSGQGVDPSQLAERFRSYPANHAHLLRAALEVYAIQRGKPYCGEKSPENIHYDEKILSFYPGARILLTVRDPRAVALSARSLPFVRKNALYQALSWKHVLKQMEGLQQRFPASVRVLRYESLLSSPAAELDALNAWLGLTPDPGQLDFSRPSHPFYKQDAAWMTLASKPIDPSRAEAWRQSLSPEDAAAVSIICGKEMQRWDYDPLDVKQGPLLFRIQCRLKAFIYEFLFFTGLRRIFRFMKHRSRKYLGINPDFFKK